MRMYGFMLECEKQNKELTKNVEYYKNKSKRLETQLKKQQEINQKAIEHIKNYSSYINYLSPDKHKEIGRLEAYNVKELLEILEDKEV